MDISSIRKIVALTSLLGAILGAWILYDRHPVGRRVSRTLRGLNLLHYSKLLERMPSKSRRALTGEQQEDSGTPRALAPRLEPDSCFRDGPLRVNVHAASPRDRPRYTTDGSIPTRRSPRAEGVLLVDRSQVVRIKSFADGLAPSETTTATYVVAASHDLDVASLVVDPAFLHDPHSGIYANPFRRGRAWERPALLELLAREDGIWTRTDVRIRIHGNSTRGDAKKSFRLEVPDGGSHLRDRFGPDRDRISENQRQWVLRHVNHRFLYRDRLSERIAGQMGIPTSPMLPVVLHLNGMPFGVYDLEERVNREFVAAKDPGKRITLLRGGLSEPKEVSGDRRDWLEFLEFVRANDVHDPEVYDRIDRKLDLDRFVDFWCLIIFVADIDRPDSNMDIYRTSDDGPWRFLAWDFDAGFNYRGLFLEHDTLAWELRDRPRPDLKIVGSPDTPRHVRSTMLFRRLMEHPEIRRRFRERFELLLDTTFSTENLSATFDDLLATSASAREVERLRFPGDDARTADAKIDEQIAMIREFIERRPGVVRGLLARHFGGESTDPVRRTSAAITRTPPARPGTSGSSKLTGGGRSTSRGAVTACGRPAGRIFPSRCGRPRS